MGPDDELRKGAERMADTGESLDKVAEETGLDREELSEEFGRVMEEEHGKKDDSEE